MVLHGMPVTVLNLFSWSKKKIKPFCFKVTKRQLNQLKSMSKKSNCYLSQSKSRGLSTIWTAPSRFGSSNRVQNRAVVVGFAFFGVIVAG
jgi:hypothetical protein